MKQVFLSYSTIDIQQTIELRDYLEENDVSCWMGKRDIPPGADYTVEITSAIAQCEVFILILTQNAQNSQYVKSEIECARAKNKLIIPYILEKFPISESFTFHIRDKQWISVYEKPQEAKTELLLCIKKLTENEADASDGTHDKSQTHHTSKIKCPICKSTNLRESDVMEKLKSIANGFKSIQRFAWKTCIALIVMIIMVFLLLNLPSIRRNLEPVLYPIADLIYVNSSEVLNPIHKNGVEQQLLMITVYVIYIYIICFMLPIILLALATDAYRAYKYRVFLKKGENKVEYLCIECNQLFTVSFNTDEIIARNERQTNPVRNVLRAISSLFFVIIPMILLGLAMSIFIVVRTIILLIKSKTNSENILERIVSKLELLPLIHEGNITICEYFCNEMDTFILMT